VLPLDAPDAKPRTGQPLGPAHGDHTKGAEVECAKADKAFFEDTDPEANTIAAQYMTAAWDGASGGAFLGTMAAPPSGTQLTSLPRLTTVGLRVDGGPHNLSRTVCFLPDMGCNLTCVSPNTVAALHILPEALIRTSLQPPQCADRSSSGLFLVGAFPARLHLSPAGATSRAIQTNICASGPRPTPAVTAGLPRTGHLHGWWCVRCSPDEPWAT
jgi:hypothetical protein